MEDTALTELIKKHDLFVLFNKNTDDTKRKILDLMLEPPSPSDALGWLYGFFAKEDGIQSSNNFKIKLGRTERSPTTRVNDEWDGDMLFCIKTSQNKRLERLVHLFFDFCRIARHRKVASKDTMYKINHIQESCIKEPDMSTYHSCLEYSHPVEISVNEIAQQTLTTDVIVSQQEQITSEIQRSNLQISTYDLTEDSFMKITTSDVDDLKVNMKPKSKFFNGKFTDCILSLFSGNKTKHAQKSESMDQQRKTICVTIQKKEPVKSNEPIKSLQLLEPIK